MAETPVHVSRKTAAPSGARLGDRVRLLRVAAGLTQTELAGDRFSKEYVSQIERGKTRPTPETIAWLAERLNVDPGFLSSGVSTDERGRVEALLARAEALSQRLPLQGGRRRLRRRPGRRLGHELGRARRAHPLRRGLGADAGGRRAHRRRASHRRPRARGRRGLLRRRPGRAAFPARRLPIQAFEQLDRGGAPRRGARPRGAQRHAV